MKNSIMTLRTAAYAIVVIVGSWYMLGQLASVLRPLLMAVLVAYILVPYYSRLHRYVPAPLALALLGGLATLVLAAVATLVTSSLLDLSERTKFLQQRAISSVHDFVQQLKSMPMGERIKISEQGIADQLTKLALTLANILAVSLPEVFATGLYLMFILLESARFPNRVRSSYPTERAERILDVFGRINSAIISFLKAKVRSSLMLAIPVGVILTILDVPFAFLWAVLTFVCNFIPYLGSVVGCGLPIVFSFLHSPGWKDPTIVAGLLLACHIISASVLEPMLIGKAVGLSPLVILAALSIWGLLWGLSGMFLAVPLTVVVKIVLENIDITRPMAGLLNSENKHDE